jgi:hypothetical protein
MNPLRNQVQEPDYDKWNGLSESKRSIANAVAESLILTAKDHPMMLVTQFSYCFIATLILYFQQGIVGVAGAIIMGGLAMLTLYLMNMDGGNNRNAKDRKRTAKPPSKS